MSTAGRPAVTIAPPWQATGWMDRAACAGMPVETFFEDRNETTEARRVCGRCPVITECLAYAMILEAGSVWKRYGVWGGKTGPQRAAIARRQRKAREAAPVPAPLPPEPGTKRCPHPDHEGPRVLPLAEFARRRSGKYAGQYVSRCKPCLRRYMRERRAG